MRARGFAIVASILACAALGACTRAPRGGASPLPATWAGIVAAARGQTVTIAMWRGDPAVNRYMQDVVAPALRRSDDIRLRFVPAQGEQIVSALMT